MLENWGAAISLVYIAAGIQTVGFLVRDQLVLRAMILAGTILYIVYYYTEPETPLWDAMICGALMATANLYTMVRLMLDRRPTVFTEEDLVVYRALPQVSPGEFRRLVAIAERETTSAPLEVTREGVLPEHLYYLVDGAFMLDKRGNSRRIDGPTFLGEIAYMLDRPASATATLEGGARYIRWKVTDLKALIAKDPILKNALEFAFNRDLAVKVVDAR